MQWQFQIVPPDFDLKALRALATSHFFDLSHLIVLSTPATEGIMLK